MVPARRVFVSSGRVAICYYSAISQPVKLSDGLVLEARLTGEAMQRSIAGQVEFWARLGRSVDSHLEGRQVLDLCRRGGSVPVSEILESVDSPAGRARVAGALAAGPFPQYEPHPDRRGLLVRMEEDGTRTEGRFVGRRFQPAGAK